MTDLAARLAAALSDRYRLDREIGRGGMATVYLAHDIKHDRRVAVKILHPHVATAVGNQRFVQEIRVAARLSHPHILGLIDSGAIDLPDGESVPFYVMPYVEGETLRDRLAREGQLPIDDARRLAAEVADALGYAHARGVVHRDIKPENILLVGSHALVADFGVAKAIETAAEQPLTTAGVVLGTVAYMSPEQATLDGPLDGRSDIYALGIVLYEMLTGELPFGSGTTKSQIARRLVDTPPPVRTLRPSIPASLEAAVTRALEPVAADRFATAEDFAAALSSTGTGSAPVRRAHRGPVAAASAVGTLLVVAAIWFGTRDATAPAAGPRSLAVLPFASPGASPDNEYFSDGMTDEVAAALGKVRGLRVAARSSAYQFKGQAVTPQEVGRRLEVDGVVEGSVRRSGDRIRISAQLVNTRDGLTLWSETYERPATDVFTLHDDITRDIARALRLTMTGASRSQTTENVEAHDQFLKGRYFWARRDHEGLRRGIEHFERAIALDSSYARAWAGLGDAYSLLGGFGFMAPAEAYSRARAATHRALALDSALADAHTALGFIHLFYDWDWTAARARFEQALSIDPRYSEARLFYAWYLMALNRPQEAVSRLREAVADEPVSLILNARLGTMLMLSGQYEAAIAQHQRTLELDSTYAISYLDLARAHAELGQYDRALAALQRTRDTVGAFSIGVRGYILAKMGRRQEAMNEIRRLTAERARGAPAAGRIAAIYAALGDRDNAFVWLDRAYADRNWVLFFSRADPMLRALHGDPRWGEFVRRMNFPS